MVHKGEQHQVEREGLIWLFASVILALAPFVTRVPVWLTVIFVVCIVYRVQIYRGRFDYPPTIVKWLLVGGGVVAVFSDYRTLFGPEAGVALLVLTYSLKLLEMHREKDAYVVVILSYFMVATHFLHSTSLISSLYMMVVIVTITGSLVALNQKRLRNETNKTFKVAVVMLIQSFPLTLLLFVFFPRLPPIWSMEMGGGDATTGLSDSMSPSDVANLGQSDKLAFRAEFDGKIPETEDLYWRAMVFEFFNGRSWSATYGLTDNSLANVYWASRLPPDWVGDSHYLGDPIEYEVIMEPTNKHYIPALDMPSSNQFGVGLSPKFALVSRDKVNSVKSFKINSYLNFSIDKEISQESLWSNTLIVDQENSRSREFAEALFESSGRDVGSYIQSVMRHFNEQAFSYTLSPPTASNDIVDHFLLDTKEGFCIHFAGAFVYLMRAVGIPARVVVGFHGGETNPIGSYVLVHQFDAHGWAEVWLEGRGWTRFDPTAYVAPDRILEGVRFRLRSESDQLNPSVFSTLNIRRIPLLNQVRLSIDYINFAWDQFVVGYNENRQKELLQRYFDGISAASMMVLVIVMFGASLLIMAYIMFRLRPTKERDVVDQAYLKLCQKVAKRGVGKGLERNDGETPYQYAERVKSISPDLYGPLYQATQRYCECQFSTTYFRKKDRRRVAKEISSIRL